MATRAAKTTAKKTATARKTTAAKTGSGRAPRKTATGKTAAKKPPTRLALVETPPPNDMPTRARDFITDAQIYATHAAKQAGIPIHRIRDWADHQDGTATRALKDGTLHYTHETRTLTWQATCRMGAVHTYVINGRANAAAARVEAATCAELHDDLAEAGKPLTAAERAEMGFVQTPTWARKDVIGEEPTVSIPVDEKPVAQAIASAADTQPMSTEQIAAHIAETAKEHPQP
jgi:hypothetical protein